MSRINIATLHIIVVPCHADTRAFRDKIDSVHVRPIRRRYFAMTSCRSNSRMSFRAADNEFGKDDLMLRVGANNVGGVCTS
jgi:hypothetical protein